MSNYSSQQIFSEFQASLKLSFPLIISELVYGLNGFLSTMMIAHLGREELAANALVWGIFITLILLFIGILSATGILVAQSYGAKDKRGVHLAANQGIILGVIFAVPMMLIMLLAPKILILTGQSPEIIKIAIPYFHALSWCMLPLNLLIVFEQFLMGIAKTRLVLLISLISVPIQLLCFYLFIFGKFGFPKVGLAGIGYGSTLSWTITAIIVGLYVRFSHHCSEYKIFSKIWQYNKKFFVEIIRIGAPIGGMYAIELALFTTIAFMVGKFGADALAAHQIAHQCFGFALTVIFGLSQATGIRVGHEVGRNYRSAMKLAVYVNMAIGFCWMLLLAAIYIGIPKKIIGLDVDITKSSYKFLVEFAVNFLFVAALLQLTDCFRLLSVAALRGLKDTRIPMFVSVFGFWLIAFPTAYAFGFVLHWGAVGVWWGLMVGLVISAAILFTRFKYLANKLDLQSLVTRHV